MNKTIAFFMIVLALNSSCSGDSDNHEAVIDGTTLLPKKIHLTQQGSSPGLLLFRDYTFLYNGNKLISTAGDGEIIASYTYNNDRLARIDLSGPYHAGQYVLLYYDADGNFTEYTEFNPTTNTGKKHVLARVDENINELIYKGNMINQSVYDGVIYRRIHNGNIMSMQFYDPYLSYSYGFDSKNNPFKNISNFEVFKLLQGIGYPCSSSTNNVIAYTSSGVRSTCNNSYNSAGFLTSTQTMDDFNSPTLKTSITY